MITIISNNAINPRLQGYNSPHHGNLQLLHTKIYNQMSGFRSHSIVTSYRQMKSHRISLIEMHMHGNELIWQ